MSFLLAPIPIAVGVGSSILTGIATFLAFKQKGSESVNSGNTDSKGEISNNIQLALENNSQNNMLVLLVAILVLLKFIELIVFAYKAHRRSIKKGFLNGVNQHQIRLGNNTQQPAHAQV